MIYVLHFHIDLNRIIQSWVCLTMNVNLIGIDKCLSQSTGNYLCITCCTCSR